MGTHQVSRKKDAKRQSKKKFRLPHSKRVAWPNLISGEVVDSRFSDELNNYVKVPARFEGDGHDDEIET